MTDKNFSPLMASPEASNQSYLFVESGTQAGRRFELAGGQGPMLMGRSADCHLTFDHQQEPMVGRRHAQLEVRSNGVFLVDLHSANGTFLNDHAVEGEVRLADGDRFQLGGEGGPWLTVHLPTAAHVVPPAPPASIAPPAPIASPEPAYRPPMSAAPPSRAFPEPEYAPPPSHPIHHSQPELPRAAAPVPPPTTSLPIAHVRKPPTPRQPPPPPQNPALRGLARYPVLRQALVISLLLSVACLIGALLGVRNAFIVEVDEAAAAAE